MALIKENLDVLKAPFKAKEHEFMRGYTYITEFAIVSRIEEVDPAWEFVITALESRPAMGDKDQVQVTCTAALTISGVTRYGVGQAKAYETNPSTDKKTGELKPTEEANEAEKSAATDALKRAARLFGIGRYLLVLPKDVKNETQLGTWIKKGLAAKAKAEALQDDTAYAIAVQMVADYLEIEAERILTGDPEGKQPRNDREQQAWDEEDEIEREQREYEELLTGDPKELYDALSDQAKDELETEKPPIERYTTPTNIVVTKAGDDKKYNVIEQCAFFSREAFRLLDYDEAIIEDLRVIGVTKLPDMVTIVYTQEGMFKHPLRIRRNSTNEVVDVTNTPFLLQDSEKA